MENLKRIIEKKKAKKPAPIYIHFEFQDYGVYLSEILHDPKHKALYIKLAKEKPRGLLEEAKGCQRLQHKISQSREVVYVETEGARKRTGR